MPVQSILPTGRTFASVHGQLAIVFRRPGADSASIVFHFANTTHDALKSRIHSVLGRGTWLSVRKSSGPRSGRRGDAGRVVGSPEAAVPAQPCEHLSACRW